jgi:glycosyltransferase involved in cell wall biosynthesis
MISILTLTYQRHQFLEEAIQSYLLQNWRHSEMVILNDSPEVEYVFDHPQVKIINLKERFSSVGKKLEYGFTQCLSQWIYRLDDDDLLSPYAKEVVEGNVTMYPHKDVLRCQKHYFMSNNKFEGYGDSINNGNCYNWDYIKRVGKFIDKSIGEDDWLTFHNNGDIYTNQSDKYSMIYRWGMPTYHISAMGNKPPEEINNLTDKRNTETGVIRLEPKFREDYWSQIP